MAESYVLLIQNGIGWSAILVFAFGMFRMTNGRLNGKVDKDSCHSAQDSIKDKIEQSEKHMDTRMDDIKDLIIKNGGPR